MKIIHGLTSDNIDKGSVLTLGMFDGVHIAHRQILSECVYTAKENGQKSLCLTYHPHPMNVFKKKNDFEVLTTLEEKLSFIEECGVDATIIINFTEDFSFVSAEDFLSDVKDKLNPYEIIVGYRTTFGNRRQGNAETLRKFGEKNDILTRIITHISKGVVTVSSSEIRNLLKRGEVEKANSLLGYKYNFSGTVIEGDKRGRTLGFKTANIEVNDKQKLIPMYGVYSADVLINGEKYKSVLNIGTRPTFDRDFSIETHILDFDRDIYNSDITIYITDFLRNIVRFSSKEELIKQIKEDILRVI